MRLLYLQNASCFPLKARGFRIDGACQATARHVTRFWAADPWIVRLDVPVDAISADCRRAAGGFRGPAGSQRGGVGSGGGDAHPPGAAPYHPR
jgi:hypothetical protein